MRFTPLVRRRARCDRGEQWGSPHENPTAQGVYDNRNVASHDPVSCCPSNSIRDYRAGVEPAHQRCELHLVAAAVGGIDDSEPNDTRTVGVAVPELRGRQKRTVAATSRIANRKLEARDVRLRDL